MVVKLDRLKQGDYSRSSLNEHWHLRDRLGEGRIMSAPQIWIVAAAILGLTTCAARAHVAPPTTNASGTPQPAVTSPPPATSRPAPAPMPEPKITARAPQAAKKPVPPVAKPPAPVAQATKPASAPKET